MNNKIKSLAFIALLMSCTNEDISQKANSSERNTIICDITSSPYYYDGTVCCVSGYSEAAPGEVLNYQYHSNIADATITWTVVEGSMTIIEGQNTSNVKIEFGDDFTYGEIIGLGESDIKVCSENISIRKLDL